MQDLVEETRIKQEDLMEENEKASHIKAIHEDYKFYSKRQNNRIC